MKLIFFDHAWDHCLYWQKIDKKILRRVNTHSMETKHNPFESVGKSEPLKHALSGYWSRRINNEHRFVYKVTEDEILIAQMRYHYGPFSAPTISLS